jgi:hypothetical protein
MVLVHPVNCLRGSDKEDAYDTVYDLAGNRMIFHKKKVVPLMSYN